LDKLAFHIKTLKKWLNNLKSYKNEIENLYGLPLKESDIENIDNDKRLRELIDLIIFNFTKIQALLGEKVFREVAELMLLEYKDFLDLLGKLEKNGVLDVYEWKKLRVIRNNFSHEYPDEIEEITLNLNEAIRNVEVLERVINNIIKKWEENE